jgi:DNA-binding beta-propeller fold protein YncE
MGLFVVVFWCAAVARSVLRCYSRFGVFNSRLGANKFPFSGQRELAGKSLISFAIFGAETALFGHNQKEFPVFSRWHGNLPTGRSQIGTASRAPAEGSGVKSGGGSMRSLTLAAAVVVLIFGGLIGAAWSQASGQILIIGNDEKQGWDENAKPILYEPGKDSLSIIDISKPDMPRVAATIPLTNSVVGPPTNLAIHPSGEIALVANSMAPVIEGWGQKLAPDDKVSVIDLKAAPPKVIGTITVGQQPSGMAISPKGDLALVANRADGTISVLSIRGKDILVVGTVPVGTPADQVSAVAITPDGKRALAVKSAANKVALLSIDGDKVTYGKQDLPAGVFPYNVVITPDGKLALTADNGAGGGSDGSVDTVSVIDLEANPPRVIDRVTVGDAPEGLAVSPKGDLAIVVELRGSNLAKTSPAYHPAGAVTALKIDGKKVINVGSVNVGSLPEGVAFGPDGQYIYVANFIDKDLWVLRVDGTKLTDTTQRIKLPGHPASMRSGPQ